MFIYFISLKIVLQYGMSFTGSQVELHKDLLWWTIQTYLNVCVCVLMAALLYLRSKAHQLYSQLSRAINQARQFIASG